MNNHWGGGGVEPERVVAGDLSDEVAVRKDEEKHKRYEESAAEALVPMQKDTRVR